eukprot:TRINITY_DN14404_c0_g1_i1.p1 TRINITY_DN14404_c0_g1~~TRINITY_DN14404_c0_g1_i1.p1  ORF type:complete len:517 (-),score=94.73 TRINITY_DN14404_c0_g1_i1:21-1571(-)
MNDDGPSVVVCHEVLYEGWQDVPDVEMVWQEPTEAENLLATKIQAQSAADEAFKELKALEQQNPGVDISLGSIGHPSSCASACRFMKRPAGCVNSTACARCHLCTWSKATLKLEKAAKTWAGDHSKEQFPDKFVSLGSLGHPHHCAWPCRFIKRPAGCLGKEACPRCHLCTWSKASLKMEEAAKKSLRLQAAFVSAATEESVFRSRADSEESELKARADSEESLFRTKFDKARADSEESLFRTRFDKARADSEESLFRTRFDSEESLFRIRADSEESLFRVRADSEESLFRARADSEESLLKAKADSEESFINTAVGYPTEVLWDFAFTPFNMVQETLSEQDMMLASKAQAQAAAEEAFKELTSLQEQHPDSCVSLGSIGHPHQCASACRFMKRAAGCIHGTSCARCHLCVWSKATLKLEKAAKTWAGEFSLEQSPGTFASLGSVGHPYHCAWPCRFMKRPAGCLRKEACPRCHECTWSKATLKMEEASKKVTTLPAVSFDAPELQQALRHVITME